MCGAEFVNRRFLSWLQSSKYAIGKDELCSQADHLGLSMDEFLALASHHFEKLKIDYNSEMPIYSINTGSNLTSRAFDTCMEFARADNF